MNEPVLQAPADAGALLLNSPDARYTEHLGREIAQFIKPGDVLPLRGGFGGGKTTFAQGVGLGLGITRPLVSPSFGLVNSYQAPGGLGLILHHLDLYRVSTAEEALAFGVEEALGADGVALIEWPQAIEELLPADRLEIGFEYVDEILRRLRFQATGARSAGLLAEYSARLGHG